MNKIQVVARPARFRRAGREFTQVPTEIDVADLSPDQLKALREEPNLVVSAVADTEADKAKGAKK